jgi:hypothetical protein
MHRVANDSLYNFKAIQQTQLLTFEEEARQQQVAAGARGGGGGTVATNIQYALIALGIVAFLLGFLIFSRSLRGQRQGDLLPLRGGAAHRVRVPQPAACTR